MSNYSHVLYRGNIIFVATAPCEKKNKSRLQGVCIRARPFCKFARLIVKAFERVALIAAVDLAHKTAAVRLGLHVDGTKFVVSNIVVAGTYCRVLLT